jgi:hypothetical protein
MYADVPNSAIAISERTFGLMRVICDDQLGGCIDDKKIIDNGKYRILNCIECNGVALRTIKPGDVVDASHECVPVKRVEERATEDS